MNKGTLWLQVWRHHKVMNYRLVQETPVYVTKGERERERDFLFLPILWGKNPAVERNARKVLFYRTPFFKYTLTSTCY